MNKCVSVLTFKLLYVMPAKLTDRMNEMNQIVVFKCSKVLRRKSAIKKLAMRQ